jgi:hypothetical protein
MVQYSTIPMVVSIGLAPTCSTVGVGSNGIVFRRELRASLSLLETALRWDVDSNLKVIHLSLGIVRGESGQLFSDVCRKACEKGLIIVVAATSLSEQIYPATLETVIGVTLDRQSRESDLVFFRDGSIEFGACGHSRPLPEMAPGSSFSGRSFAAAHITACVVSLLESHPLADYADIKKMLIGEAHVSTL